MENYNPGSSYQNPPNSTMALLSLIAGILGLTLLPIMGSIAAVILGYLGRNEIRDSGGRLGGDGMATAGLVLGWIGVGLAVIGCCIAGVVLVLPLCLVPLGLSIEEFNSLLPVLFGLI